MFTIFFEVVVRIPGTIIPPWCILWIDMTSFGVNGESEAFQWAFPLDVRSSKTDTFLFAPRHSALSDEIQSISFTLTEIKTGSMGEQKNVDHHYEFAVQNGTVIMDPSESAAGT